MTVNEVEEVVIDAKDGYKFIVVKLIDNEDNKKLIIRADQNCEYHDEIFDSLRRGIRTNGLKARCIGGGRIDINPSAKIIQIWKIFFCAQSYRLIY